MSLLKRLFGLQASTEPTIVPTVEEPALVKSPSRQLEETTSQLFTKLNQFKNMPTDENGAKVGRSLAQLCEYCPNADDIEKVVAVVLNTLAAHDVKMAIDIAHFPVGAASSHRHALGEMIANKALDLSVRLKPEERLAYLKKCGAWIDENSVTARAARRQLLDLADQWPEKEITALAKMIANRSDNDPAAAREATDLWLNHVRQQDSEKALSICLSAPSPYKGNKFNGHSFLSYNILEETAIGEAVLQARKVDPWKAIALARRAMAYHDNGNHTVRKDGKIHRALETIITEAQERAPGPLPRMSIEEFLSRQETIPAAPAVNDGEPSPNP